MGSIGSALPNHASNDSSSGATPTRLLILSMPRTASNLFAKVLNVANQPSLKTNPFNGYFFYPAFASVAMENLAAKDPRDWPSEQRQKYIDLCQQCLDNLEDMSQQAQAENKVACAKEHVAWLIDPELFFLSKCDRTNMESLRLQVPKEYGQSQTYTQPTFLPDEYLRTWQMAFTIRHPALTYPSLYRALKKAGEGGFVDEDGIRGASLSNMTLRWTRAMYDWCMHQPGMPAPLVIDAHDLIHTPEVMLKVCDHTGLDKASLQFEWSKDGKKKSDHWVEIDKSNPELVENHRRAASIMLSTLEASTGLMKDKTPAQVDIAAESAKWEDEFGKEFAELIETAVQDSMEDYEYLKARRLTV